MAQSRFDALLEVWVRYERRLSTLSMVVGFCFDLIVAKRPDSVFDNLLLLSYLTIAAACIIFLNIKTRGSREEPSPEPLLLLLILQFCFGGLSSNLLVLYGKSGTAGGELLFIAILLSMLVGNEYLRSRYAQLRFNVAVYYVLLLTYCVIAVPTFILHSLGFPIFLVSGAISLALAAVFIGVLSSMTRAFRGRAGVQRLWEVGGIIGAVFLVFTGLYFLNIIPPVPLSLKDVGVYHSLVHDSSDSYSGTFEPAPFFEFWRDTSPAYTAIAGESAYCFSSVFAPTGLSTPLYHQWSHYNGATKRWDTLATISFPITGGRVQGYRGFSEKLTLLSGDWRCDVRTAGGQLIGRASFTVVASAAAPALQTRAL